MLRTVIRWELLAFLLCAGGVVAFQILVGKINTRGLLRTKPDGPLSPTRIQMVFTAIGVALWYFNQVRTSNHLESLPDIPASVLLISAGSHSTYLLGKGFTMLNWQQYLIKNK